MALCCSLCWFSAFSGPFQFVYSSSEADENMQRFYSRMLDVQARVAEHPAPAEACLGKHLSSLVGDGKKKHGLNFCFPETRKKGTSRLIKQIRVRPSEQPAGQRWRPRQA